MFFEIVHLVIDINHHFLNKKFKYKTEIHQTTIISVINAQMILLYESGREREREGDIHMKIFCLNSTTMTMTRFRLLNINNVQ